MRDFVCKREHDSVQYCGSVRQTGKVKVSEGKVQSIDEYLPRAFGDEVANRA